MRSTRPLWGRPIATAGAGCEDVPGGWLEPVEGGLPEPDEVVGGGEPDGV
jgi:hypothetical protein